VRQWSSSTTLKRWTLIKLPLSLLAGAAVTWGVAWACALWGLATLDYPISHPSGLKPSAWPAGAPRDWPAARNYRLADNNTTTELRWYQISGWTERNAEQLMYGWPLRSMEATAISENGIELSGHAHFKLHRDTSIPAPSWMRPRDEYRVLPLAPLPLGFPLNTLLAAGVVLGVEQGFALTQRKRRHVTGRCPSCDYDRSGLTNDAACPECGLDSAGWQLRSRDSTS
jgi:hypothetical protein